MKCLLCNAENVIIEESNKDQVIITQLQNEIAIVTENIGFGLDDEEVYSKNEKLLLAENVDVVVAFIDGKCAEMLTPLYAATGKILLLVNMGAHYNFDVQPSPNIIHHTFKRNETTKM